MKASGRLKGAFEVVARLNGVHAGFELLAQDAHALVALRLPGRLLVIGGWSHRHGDPPVAPWFLRKACLLSSGTRDKSGGEWWQGHGRRRRTCSSRPLRQSPACPVGQPDR